MSNSEWNIHIDGEFSDEELQYRANLLEKVPDASRDADGLISCPTLFLRDTLVFPRMVAPLHIGRETTRTAIEKAAANNQTMIALVQIDPQMERPGENDFLNVGIEMAVSEIVTLPDGSHAVLVQARRRVEIIRIYQENGSFFAQASIVDDSTPDQNEYRPLIRGALRSYERYIDLSPNIPDEAFEYVTGISDPGWLADMVAATMDLPLAEQHALVVNLDGEQRLDYVQKLLANEVGALELEEEIHSKVQKEAERGQRETYLREQMRAIQDELGEGDPWMKELEELHTKLRKTKLPKEVKDAGMKELRRLGQMPPMSPEVGVIRTYLDWILELPWSKCSEDNLDVQNASKVLDERHFGLPKAKDRILEYIAVRSLRPKNNRQPILCFVGPPGTGKTSLGRSIAAALGREFVRLSLGGVRDEAEVRGHRRTYIGALPGRILQTMRRAGTLNPLFFLDEIDKLGSDMRGDPSSALLEVLDPEQNDAFSDHYLEMPYDLSKVMFITTANSRNDIPWALLDRLEVIEFPGYIEEEKLEISRRFLIQRQLEENGLGESEIQFSEAALKAIVREYTYEAGVRNLEREIGRVCRKVARLKAEGKRFPSRIDVKSVEKYLGPPQFTNTQAESEDEVGVATAVAWTEAGGDIMPIEVLLMEGKGNMQITGNIGDIMEESGQAALSYLKSRANDLGIKMDVFESTDVHIHIPEGAVPKDGPSAGITLATAIISAFTGRAVRMDVGMTGEVTLRGRVLPVGGVREKVLAAHRAGLKTFILPERNTKDLVDVPKKALTELKIVPVERMAQVLDVALVEKKKPAASRTANAKPSAKTSGKGKTSPLQPGV
ncbi:MAG: endopeptidase La [Anaerolineae bacterium]|nr:endopeptidase La [Anaerolineae bacterium]